MAVLAALAAILVRIPFLFKADAFFNADEAVHGLMAHHLGELPLMLWGQGYKGVPEVYFEGAVFALFDGGNAEVMLRDCDIMRVASDARPVEQRQERALAASAG